MDKRERNCGVTDEDEVTNVFSSDKLLTSCVNEKRLMSAHPKDD